MAEYNVTIKRYNGSTWDAIYPRTTAENIISGTFSVERLPEIPVRLLTNEGQSSQKIDASLLPAIALTNVTVHESWNTFKLSYEGYPSGIQEGDIIIITSGDNRGTYVHNGGTSGKADEDFTLMELPNNVVTSVAGKTGVVTLSKSDVGLGNVDNTSDENKPVSNPQKAYFDTLADSVKQSRQNRIPYITVSDDKIIEDPNNPFIEGDIIFSKAD